MKKFSEIAAENYKDRDIRIRVGDCYTYVDAEWNCLEQLSPERIKWLDSHKYIHYRSSATWVELVYRKNDEYERIFWND